MLTILSISIGFLLGYYTKKWSKDPPKQKDLWQPVMKKNLK
jgi:hypothetical protein